MSAKDFPYRCTECNELVPKKDSYVWILLNEDGTRQRMICNRCKKEMFGGSGVYERKLTAKVRPRTEMAADALRVAGLA